MLEAADPIERYMVIPGSFGVLVFGVILALLTGVPLFGFLQGASRNWLLVSNVLVLLTVPLVPWVFIPRGRVFDRLLEEAVGQGKMTPSYGQAWPTLWSDGRMGSRLPRCCSCSS